VDHITPSLLDLLAPLAPAFRREVFPTFRAMTAAWVVCLGRRTLSRVWETTGHSGHRHHAAAFRLFSQAVWNWHEVMRLLLAALLATFVPGTRVWVVVDDTLCHKRGAKVAFGGIFLDAVLSSRRHKTFRFGNNWVLLGLVVSLPFRHDRHFCVPLLWRVYEKRLTRSKAEHRTKTDLAADMIRTLAGWLPGHEILVVADSAYVGKALLKNRPANVDVIGPACWRAALTAVTRTRDGRVVSSGERLPTPRAILADDRGWPPATRVFTFANGRRRRLQVKSVLAGWPSVAGERPVAVVLVRDPKGEWRDEALVSTNPRMCDWEVVVGYCRRWSVEVAIADAKGRLGFHDPCVWKRESVRRAAPMAWFVGAVVLLWYARSGREHRPAQRQQPWHPKGVTTFADMLACCRLAQWEGWWSAAGDSRPARVAAEAWLLEYMATAA
jgi:hypothetical protein